MDRYRVYREENPSQWTFESCDTDDRGGCDTWEEAYAEALRSARQGPARGEES